MAQVFYTSFSKSSTPEMQFKNSTFCEINVSLLKMHETMHNTGIVPRSWSDGAADWSLSKMSFSNTT